jgi:hypothetical protein
VADVRKRWLHDKSRSPDLRQPHAQAARSSRFATRGAREAVIQVVIYPAAPAGIVAFATILWDLRTKGKWRTRIPQATIMTS